MNFVYELLMVALLAVGCVFVLVGSFGLVKLSDFFKRLHGPTKATTLGVGCILIASIGHHAALGDGLVITKRQATALSKNAASAEAIARGLATNKLEAEIFVAPRGKG